MSDENKGGKWAAEVYDFLRLFRRINTSIYGLLLLEIGWVLFLLLVSQLTPSDGDTPIIPTIVLLGQKSLPVIDLLIPGSVFLGLLWAFGSGLWIYIWLPIKRLLCSLLILLIYLEILALLLLTVLLLPVTWPLEFFLSRRWLRRLNPKDRAEIKEILIKETQAKVEFEALLQDRPAIVSLLGYGDYELWLKSKRNQLSTEEQTALWNRVGERCLHKKAAEEATVRRLFLLDWMKERNSNWLQNLSSRAVIGLAPLKTFSYREDLNAAKAPAQIYATAIERLRWQLATWKVLPHLEFQILPEHLAPKNSSEASWLRRALGLDVLLWGSYLVDDPQRIWLNMERALRVDEKERLQKGDEENHKRRTADVFRVSLDIDAPTIVINQQNPWDVYVALLIAILQTLYARKKSWQAPINRFTPDMLTFGGIYEDRLIEHLVEDAFFAYQALPSEKKTAAPEMYPEPALLLADLAGRWVGSALKKKDDLVKRAPQLLRVLQHCIELNPLGALNYYRQGALYCLLDQPQKALDAFATAEKYESADAQADAYYIYAEADLARDELERAISSDLTFIRYVTSIARAINLGETPSGHKQSFEKTTFATLESLSRNKSQRAKPSTARVVLSKLLKEDQRSDIHQPRRK